MPRCGTVYVGELLSRHPALHAYSHEMWEFPALRLTPDVIALQQKFVLEYKSNWDKLGEADFLPFMIAGLVLSVADLTRQARVSIVDAVAAPTTLLLLFVAIYAAIHILSWSQVRYRLPVDALLILFAAAAIAELTGRILSFRQVTAPGAGVQS